MFIIKIFSALRFKGQAHHLVIVMFVTNSSLAGVPPIAIEIIARLVLGCLVYLSSAQCFHGAKGSYLPL